VGFREIEEVGELGFGPAAGGQADDLAVTVGAGDARLDLLVALPRAR